MKEDKFTRQNLVSRNIGIELLRILLMFLIVIYHIIIHGSNLNTYMQDNELVINNFAYLKIFITSFLLFPVDCFIFISGFYRINMSFIKILKFWFQCLFYSVGIYLISLVFTDIPFSLNQLIKSFLPISFPVYWFIAMYIFLIMISPILNLIIDKMSKELYQYTIVVIFALNCIFSFIFKDEMLGASSGASLLNFVFIYFMAYYIRKYINIEKFKIKQLSFIYVFSSILIFLVSIFLLKKGNQISAFDMFSFNNPLVLISAACIFIIFYKIKFTIDGKKLAKISTLVFGIYLIHDNPITRKILYENNIFDFYNNKIWFYVPFIIIYAIVIFIISLLIEKIRIILMNPLENYLFKKTIIARINDKIVQIIKSI